jgi:hypothetical protein
VTPDPRPPDWVANIPRRIAPATVPGGLSVNIYLAEDATLLGTYRVTDRTAHVVATGAHAELAEAYPGERVVACTYDGDTGAFIALAGLVIDP